jgi:uncharacterized protein YegP (UPF0339 family)
MIYLRKSADGKFYFIVKHANGQTLVTSETYTRKFNCNRTAQRMKGSCNGVIDQTLIKPSRKKVIPKVRRSKPYVFRKAAKKKK